jgi:hypothetical protein
MFENEKSEAGHAGENTPEGRPPVDGEVQPYSEPGAAAQSFKETPTPVITAPAPAFPIDGLKALPPVTAAEDRAAKEAARQARGAAGKAAAALAYCFDFSSALTPSVDAQPGVRGLRMQALYKPADPANVRSNGKNAYLKLWQGLTGSTRSGGDFMLLRKDGVLELDGRITIKAENGPLIDLVYRGNVDLLNIKLFKDLGDKAYGFFLQQKPSFDLPLSVHVAFETASGPWLEEGEDMSWIKNRYRDHIDNSAMYQGLTRHTFMGRGSLRFEVGKPVNMTMQVHQLLVA